MRTIVLLIYVTLSIIQIAVHAQQENSQKISVLDQYIQIVNQVGQKSVLSNTGFFNYQIKVQYTKELYQNIKYELIASEAMNGFVFLVTVPQSQLNNKYFQLFMIMQLDLFFNTFKYFDQHQQQVDLRYDMQKFIFFAHTMPRLKLPRILAEFVAIDFQWMTPISVYETYVNLESGSLNAKLYFYRHLQNTLNIINDSLSNETNISSTEYRQFIDYLLKVYQIEQNISKMNLSEVVHQIDFRIYKLSQSAQKWYRNGLKEYEERKKQNKDLLLKSDLADLVKSNSRTEVAYILDVIIPWEVLEPSEVRYWQQYLEAIRKPNYNNSFVIYRGSDEKDRLQLTVNQNKEITSLSVFAKKLTTGSGSHIYRLLGLPQLFERNAVLGNQDYFKPYIVPHTFTALVTNHSINPLGSTFISWSLSPEIAFRFVTSMNSIFANPGQDLNKLEKDYISSSKSGAVIAARVDPRRLFVNSFSGYRQELEVVAPFIVFPDEIIHFKKGLRYAIYQNGEIKKMVNETAIEFADQVSIKLDNLLSMKQMDKSQIVKSGINKLAEQLNQISQQANRLLCDQVFL